MDRTNECLDADCIFCKIIRGQIPSQKIHETDFVYAFLDIDPVSEGHFLIIPKYHAEKLHEVPDKYLSALLLEAKKIIQAHPTLFTDYNVLQNNGKLAGQLVKHAHVHIMPKPTGEQGLQMRWKTIKMDADDLARTALNIASKL